MDSKTSNTDFKKRAVEILVSALLTAAIVLFAGYGYTVTVLEPLVAEGQAEARGAGVTRFTSDVQMLSSLTVDDNITAGGTLAGADLAATDDLTVADDLTVSGDLAVTGANSFTGGAQAAYITATSSLSASNATVSTWLQSSYITATSSISGAALHVPGAAIITGVLTLGANPIFSSESITPTDGGTFTPTASLVTLTPAGALGTALGACTTGQRTTLYNSINASVVISDTGNFIGAGDATLTQFDTLSLVCITSKWVQVGTVPDN